MSNHGIRIVGGKWRGRKLPVLEREGLRPTASRVRETLFNWLQFDVVGAHCLDLFAGTGAVSFEALSRGATNVTMVERDASVAKNLRQLSATLDAQDLTSIMQKDALVFLKNSSDAQYDLVFLDPPFSQNLHEAVLQILPAYLKPHHHVYVEAPKNWVVPAGWQVKKSGKAGQVGYYLLQHLSTNES